jgi:hypothetical protein
VRNATAQISNLMTFECNIELSARSSARHWDQRQLESLSYMMNPAAHACHLNLGVHHRYSAGQ